MPEREFFVLRDYLGLDSQDRAISDAHRVVSLTNFRECTCLSNRFSELARRSVLIAVSDQLIAGLLVIELDGFAHRMLLCPPDVNADYLHTLIKDAEIDAVITDQPERWTDLDQQLVLRATLPTHHAAIAHRAERATEWLMLTSGTSGMPKIVSHTLDGLAGAIIADGTARANAATKAANWATFYDIRRYGGLQIFLRAIIGGGSIVLSSPGETLADHVTRLQACGVTHISGTPSHWRKLLMSGATSNVFTPSYVRLSGEIADQALLDGLRAAFPAASIGHAYASTEAGVGFAIDDGREGFPAEIVGKNRNGVQLKVEAGSLYIRSRRAAHSYVGQKAGALTDSNGFVDTGDMVELRGDRYHFIGRRGGIINVGGFKVHPEEIETVINRRPEVRMSCAKSRRSPITGGIVVADVILAENVDTGRSDEIRARIFADCKACLAPHKVPAVIKFVSSLAITPAGKLSRHVD